MSCTIGIIDYGIAGNIYNIKKAIEKAGGQTLIIQNESELKKVDKIVIPGVGSFKDAMSELNSKSLVNPLIEFINKKPTLGICLGMQILSTIGFECEKTNGLNIINAEVKPIISTGVIPHMGFNNIDIIKSNKLLKGLEDEEFYFMHSFEMVNFHDVTSTTTYEQHQFVSSIQKNHIYGVQFHPEKSRDAGIKLFKNFINL